MIQKLVDINDLCEPWTKAPDGNEFAIHSIKNRIYLLMAYSDGVLGMASHPKTMCDALALLHQSVARDGSGFKAPKGLDNPHVYSGVTDNEKDFRKLQSYEFLAYLDMLQGCRYGR